MENNELIRFANNLASVQKAKDITDFYNELPIEMAEESKLDIIRMEFYPDVWIEEDW